MVLVFLSGVITQLEKKIVKYKCKKIKKYADKFILLF